MTDIVITYLNERDPQWRKDFQYWKDKEVRSGKARLSNRQAFGEERTREWDILKYWFRGVEVNCPWFNKIIFIVQNKNHIPEWLDTNNPKLKIVYHEDYIPKKLLPTFNAMTIGLYVSNIKELAEQYIMCDDDFYFLNPIKEDKFFRDNKPVHKDNKVHYGLYETTGATKVFFQTLNNDLAFETKYMKEKVKYGFYHLPSARLKSFEQKIIKDNEADFIYHNSFSKFRHKTNYCNYMFDDLLKICNKAIIDDPYTNSCYCTLTSKVDFNNYKDKDMVCFNDSEALDDYNKTKEKLIEFLEDKFPNKSSFEKE